MSKSIIRALTRWSLNVRHEVPIVQPCSNLRRPIRTSASHNPSASALSATSCHRSCSSSVLQNQLSLSPQNEFLIVIPDFPNSSAARVEAQPGHIRAATPLINAGIITYCGVTLSSALSGKEQNISGSVIVMKAQSEDEVQAFLMGDAYAKSGVWNVSAATIWNFRTG